ncbi:hypothetical protein [Nonlabens marinus]|uniref:Lipoprotein n=1 Tax=Nonlabens marinus S1-08 TaxID=1454201 RepID=W8VZE4_9FLAO|nr:hypothetical protein [Nonlabens marinus]BAO54431.1 hypothetical protein NMS_0422 [Nonlabens marinus S1-08]
MKTIFKVSLFSLALAAAMVSCRNEEESADDAVQEMIENGDEVKIKEDKIKIEDADGDETKIKYDENGNVEKIKTDDN